MVHLEYDLYLYAIHSLLLLKNEPIGKKHPTVDNIKHDFFLKNTSSMLYPVKRHLKYQNYSPENTKDVECHKNLISINRQKIRSRTSSIYKNRVKN